MGTMISLEMLPQPDDSTCGPTCLHAIYHYFGDEEPLEQIVEQCRSLEHGGTLAVFLACHALRKGYKAKIYTYNLQVFDPSWFLSSNVDICEKLNRQLSVKNRPFLQVATQGYLEFLRLGGKLYYEDLTVGLIRRYLRRGLPILTGLSATYLYHSKREYGIQCDYDDVRGEPSGHFVVLNGYDKTDRKVYVTDPHYPNPMAPKQEYKVSIQRVMGAILLGVLTHDANLLILEKAKPKHPCPA